METFDIRNGHFGWDKRSILDGTLSSDDLICRGQAPLRPGHDREIPRPARRAGEFFCCYEIFGRVRSFYR